MIRKQVYIEPEQEALLKRRARQRGVTESDLIRQGIERVSRESLAPPNLRAWEEAKAFIQERMALRAPQTGRAWTRDELYEERIGRFSRYQ